MVVKYLPYQGRTGTSKVAIKISLGPRRPQRMRMNYLPRRARFVGSNGEVNNWYVDPCFFSCNEGKKYSNSISLFPY